MCSWNRFQQFNCAETVVAAMVALRGGKQEDVMPVYRVYVEKKPEFAVEAAAVLADLRTVLGVTSVTGVRILNRYDVEQLAKQEFERAKSTIFSEPQVDELYDEMPQIVTQNRVFAVQYLPGQFDQRADSCAQCIQIMAQGERPLVKTARVFVLLGAVSEEELARIKAFVINPVESREASLVQEHTLAASYEIPTTVETLVGFTALEKQALAAFLQDYALAMDLDDIRFLQAYFCDTERRDPTITEIRMIDTYWSDHCRHTTFSTNLREVDIAPHYIRASYEKYLKCREALYVGKEKPVTLMDLAVIGAKALKAQGCLADLDESEEINACAVRIDVDIDGKDEPWILLFKNETHNHPTEIEPFGGAATCLGGAIRDPLSGRGYVYQAMRVTGAADPTVPISDTMQGKLPQRKLTTTAAAGYSSYGNQIGLATGLVNEIYHPGYAAKRMEIGAVIGAVPAKNVRREEPTPGDLVILLGGKTGRDGCGGATGSSKTHTLDSLETCGAQVQKGNAPEERKLQRLFRNPAVSRLIKRCNDFGAGGVSVAVGELADGLRIDLDAVPKKYDGLDGTELAISESQERMAVVVEAKDAQRMIHLARKENLDAVVVAEVTAEPRLVMSWNGKTIVDVARSFLNSNGAVGNADVKIGPILLQAQGAEARTVDNIDTKVGQDPLQTQGAEARTVDNIDGKVGQSLLQDQGNASPLARFAAMTRNLNVVSQKGLAERFDSTIGSGTVLMPFGGKYQLTPTQAMAAKLPVQNGTTTTCSVMAWGFNPLLSEQSPYHGAACAVVESIAKLVAAGGSARKCWLTFQEYFGRTGSDPTRWGKPFAALLGALEAQLQLQCAAIGGKDSMSGTFEQLDVPPTLVSFAVSATKAGNIISPEFKKAGSNLYYLSPTYDANGMPDFASVRALFDRVEKLVSQKQALSVWACGAGAVAEGLFKMALGNRIGVELAHGCEDALFAPCYGAFVVETSTTLEDAVLLGTTTADYTVSMGGESMELADLQKNWEQALEPVFPCNIPTPKIAVPTYSFVAHTRKSCAIKTAKPRVLIPVFPGTNCEYDTAAAFERAGADASIFVVKNLSSADIEASVAEFARELAHANIVAIPGGFSGGDEPDGSGKFITAFFRNPRITDGVHALLAARDGLMCGICNGFQALIKLGLVPYGKIVDATADSPTLTYNTIGRHQSMLVRTRVASNKSPWMMYSEVGSVYTTAISHGEGRFVADAALLQQLVENGQIATQYVGLHGEATMEIQFNPNGSVCAVEGITSPDGRVFGRMGHAERWGDHLYCNMEGEKNSPMFRGAVDYFTAG